MAYCGVRHQFICGDIMSSPNNKKPTGVSRRLLQCVKHLQTNDFEGALVNLFPAIDQTAKRRMPKVGVGKRIKGFLEQEEKLISIIATGNSFSNIVCDGVSITDALYKFGRTSIAHEGELDPRLEFNQNGSVLIGTNQWNLPSGYITGMCIAAIVSAENKDEHIEEPLSITVFDKIFLISDLWGHSSKIKSHICTKFRNEQLFS
jgi:hypothetical protein